MFNISLRLIRETFIDFVLYILGFLLSCVRTFFLKYFTYYALIFLNSLYCNYANMSKIGVRSSKHPTQSNRSKS